MVILVSVTDCIDNSIGHMAGSNVSLSGCVSGCSFCFPSFERTKKAGPREETVQLLCCERRSPSSEKQRTGSMDNEKLLSKVSLRQLDLSMESTGKGGGQDIRSSGQRNGSAFKKFGLSMVSRMQSKMTREVKMIKMEKAKLSWSLVHLSAHIDLVDLVKGRGISKTFELARRTFCSISLAERRTRRNVNSSSNARNPASHQPFTTDQSRSRGTE